MWVSHIHSFLRLLITSLTFGLLFVAAFISAPTQASNAVGCSKNESVEFPFVPESSQASFSRLIAGELSPSQSFFEAMTFKTLATTQRSPAVYFADYWLARSLYEAELYEPAFTLFSKILEKDTLQPILPLRLLAMDCIYSIVTDKLPEQAFAAFGSLNLNFPLERLQNNDKIKIRTLRLRQFLVQLNATPPSIEANGKAAPAFTSLKGSGPFEDLALSLSLIRQGNATQAISSLKRLTAYTSLPPTIENKRNEIYLLLSRALYESGQIREAIPFAEKIEKTSPLIVPALNVLAWAHLRRGDVPKAIGVASGLTKGPLRSTFSPEGQLVTAIALSEYCHYPKSRTFLNGFKKDYHASFSWLRDHLSSGKKQKETLYPKALAHLREEKSDIPDKIVNEWMRSPIVIGSQEAINFNLKRKRAVATLHGLAQALPGDKNALTAWRSALVETEGALQKQISYSQQRIETELALLNQRMYSQIIFVAENTDLLDAEINQEANKELVKLQAKSDEPSENEQANSRKPAAFSPDIYNWQTPYKEAEQGEELWLDELGAMKATLTSGCPERRKTR